MASEPFPWHVHTIGEVLKKLKVGKEGLSDKEAQQRLRRFDANVLPEPPRATGFFIFLRQLKSSFTVILGIAAAVSWAFDDRIEAVFIFAAIVANVFFGFVQEWRAERTLEALKKIIHHEASVVRDGAPRRIATENLVPGDVILLSAGERIPADARLFDIESLEINEAPLTGESFPVVKSTDVVEIGTVLADRRNMVYAGTAVTRGEGSAVVVDTGRNSEVGKIAMAVHAIPEEETPLEERLRVVARWITGVVIALAFVVFSVGFGLGLPFDEIFKTAAAVGVAAVPEGLVVAVTVILVIGMTRLVKKHALVRRLRAAETLGSVTVICVDKTGTVTEGKMRVVEVLPPQGDDLGDAREHILRTAAFANEAWLEEAPHSDGHEAGEVVGEPTDAAILTAALAAGLHEEIDARKRTVRDLLPFSSENQFVAALVERRSEKGMMIALKGATEKLLPHCTHVLRKEGRHALSPQERSALTRHHNELSEKGMRLIAVAQRQAEKDDEELPEVDTLLDKLTFLGFIALEDPVRSGVADAFTEARRAGIKIILITGDHALTAAAIAGAVGFPPGQVVHGEELMKLSDEELGEKLKGGTVFARTAPQQKLRIVEVLKRRGEVVAMTGDGINDAPALKAADIGVAVGSGTDVARESADLVILDDDFATIVSAVREGRVIFENIRKVVVFLLIDTFSEIILVLGSLLLGLPLALLATQILFVNLIEDGPPIFALAFEPGGKDIMRQKPHPPSQPILNREAFLLIFGVGLGKDLILLGAYVWLLRAGVEVATARTIVFAALGLDSFIQIFLLRNLRLPVWRINMFSNPWLLGAAGFGVTSILLGIYLPPLQAALRTVPLEVNELLLVFGLALAAVIPIELVKAVARRRPAFWQ